VGQKWKAACSGKAEESAAYFRAETEAEAIKANEQKSVRWPKGGEWGGKTVSGWLGGSVFCCPNRGRF